MKLHDIVILALAVWRITSMLHFEEGPFDVLGKIRSIAGVRYDEKSMPYATNEVSKAILCMWCLSPWVGLFIAALYLLIGEQFVYMMMPFAFSTVVILIEQVISKE